VPGELRDQDVEASLACGILRIYVPKAHNAARSSRIAISESPNGSDAGKASSEGKPQLQLDPNVSVILLGSRNVEE